MRHRFAWVAGAAALAIAVAPRGARAQQPPQPPSEAGRRAVPAEGAPEADAEARFFEGQRLYEAGDYVGALEPLRASYALVKSPNSHLYVARCLRGLGRLVEAYDEYGAVVLEAGERAGDAAKYAATQRAASEERAALRAQLAFVTLSPPPAVRGVTITLGGEVVEAGRYEREIVVHPGTLAVRADAPGRRPFDAALSLKPGDSLRVAIALPLLPPPASAPRAAEPDRHLAPPGPLAIAAAGVGVGGLVTWGVLGVVASSRHDELATRCRGRCPSSLQGDIDAGRRESFVSGAGLVVGLVGLAGGGALWALGIERPPRAALEPAPGASPPRAPPPASRSRREVSPPGGALRTLAIEVGPQGAGVSVGGSL